MPPSHTARTLVGKSLRQAPLRRVSRSQRRALCQSLAACLRDIAANRTGPATLLRQTGQGARVLGKSGKAAEIESKGASGVQSSTRRKAASPGRTSPVARIGACENRRGRERSTLPENDLPGL